MRGVALSIFLIALLTSSTAVAPPGGNGPGPGNPGLPRACEVSSSQQPCRLANVIPDTTIPPGGSETYEDGEWTVEGTIHVQAGGSLRVEDATFTFLAESGGIVADEGAVVEIVRSTLEEEEAGSPFVLDLAPGSAFTLNDSTLRGGNGVKLATSSANVSGNLLTEIPLALWLNDVVEVTIHHNHFLDNEVAVNQTGGVTTLDSNFFEGGEFCVRDWLADPTIENNVFRGCHVGIYHQRSNSVFRTNDMMDDAHEPGVGIMVEDTNSPIIEGNAISNYGTGILIRNATAYIRNNTIADNVGDGVRVEANTEPMDIQGNDIFGNGGDGISLVSAEDVVVFANDVHDNAAYGILVEASTGIVVEGNDAIANGIDGIAAVNAPGLILEDNVAQENGATGIVVGIGSTGASVMGGSASLNGQHGLFVRADGTSVDGFLANANGLTGVVVEGAQNVDLSDVLADGNDLHGFRFTTASVNASDIAASGNAQDGMHLNGGGVHDVQDANMSANGGHGFHLPGNVSATLGRAVAIANAGDGLRSASSDAVTAEDGWWEDNGGAGIRNDAPAVLLAECGYWGTNDGPTTPDNPGGTGDEAVGAVDWSPYRPDPALTSCVPTEIAHAYD